MKRAFTLIELLIVVAIIAILAAIAVPNFLEAQVRAKVSRVKADERSLATALESYYVDNNAYPPNPVNFITGAPDAAFPVDMRRLSTPIAYMTTAFITDPFGSLSSNSGNANLVYLNTGREDLVATILIEVSLTSEEAKEGIYSNRWTLSSAGPERLYRVQQIDGDPTDAVEDVDFIDFIKEVGGEGPPGSDSGSNIYDPTNGTISIGDIVRTAKGVVERGAALQSGS